MLLARGHVATAMPTQSWPIEGAEGPSLQKATGGLLCHKVGLTDPFRALSAGSPKFQLKQVKSWIPKSILVVTF